MDWAAAIERNSEALRGIVAVLFAMLEQAGGAAMARLPRPLHCALLGVLRPAESAARRLIVIAARGLAAKPVPSRPMPSGLAGRNRHDRRSFQLFDPRKRFAPQRPSPGPRVIPRIHVFGGDPRVAALWASPEPEAPPAPPPDDGCISANRLLSRLHALKNALDDLPGQARRLARLRARREKLPRLALKSPLRPGRPPGYRSVSVHAVDRILAECHGLASHAMEPDTS